MKSTCGFTKVTPHWSLSTPKSLRNALGELEVEATEARGLESSQEFRLIRPSYATQEAWGLLPPSLHPLP